MAEWLIKEEEEASDIQYSFSIRAAIGLAPRLSHRGHLGVTTIIKKLVVVVYQKGM